MLINLRPLPRFLLGMASLLVLLVVTAGLWWKLPPLPRLRGQLPQNSYNQLLLSADGRTLLACHPIGLALYDFPSLRHRHSLPVPAFGPILLAPDGRSVAFYRDQYHSGLKLWIPDVQPEPLRFVTESRMDFNEDGQTLIFWRRETGFLWDTKTAEERPLPADLAAEKEPIFTWMRGRIIASVATEGSIKVWDLSGPAKSLILNGAEEPIEIAPNGRFLAAKSGKTTKLWDARTGQELSTPDSFGPEEGLLPLTFSPDGRFLLLKQESEDHFDVRPISVWDLGSLPPARLGEFELFPVEFSSDGRWFSVDGGSVLSQGGTRGDWEFWRTTTVQRAWSLPRSESGPWQTKTLQSPGPTFAPNSETIAYRYHISIGTSPPAQWLGRDPMNAVKLVDATTGGEIASLPNAHNFFYSADGKTLVTWHEDGTLDFWDIPPRRAWWIEYGLPVLFGLLMLIGLWLVGRRVFSRRSVAPMP